MITGQGPAQQNHPLMWMISFAVAAITNFLLVIYLEKKPKRIFIDKATGREFEMSHLGTLFFISTKWWTYIFAASAIISFAFFLIRMKST